MANPFLASFKSGSFHIVNDLASLICMIKSMSLKLSDKARQRLAWMDSYRECGNAAKVARHFSISVRTFWYWKKRYDPWDLKSLEDRSRQPDHSPKQSCQPLIQAILTKKQNHPRWGKEKIALVLRREGWSVSASTCYRICARHRLIVRYCTKKRRPPKPRVNWAQIHLPGDLLEVDVKYVSWDGRRIYQYTAIDVISRWRYAMVHRHCDMATTISFLKGLMTIVPFSVRIIQTDNGSEFGSQVSSWLGRQGIRHVFSHKARPAENGYVERSHRIDEEEFWSLGPGGVTFGEICERFKNYIEMYNTERPSWALGGKTPIEALATYLLKEQIKTVQHVLT